MVYVLDVVDFVEGVDEAFHFSASSPVNLIVFSGIMVIDACSVSMLLSAKAFSTASKASGVVMIS